MKEKKARPTEENHEEIEGVVRPERSRKVVYTIVDREGGERSSWIRIGSAFLNKDQSLSVYLDALPANNKLHIRDLSPTE